MIDWHIDRFTYWQFNGLTDWEIIILTVWQTDRLSYLRIDRLKDYHIHRLTDWQSDRLTVWWTNKQILHRNKCIECHYLSCGKRIFRTIVGSKADQLRDLSPRFSEIVESGKFHKGILEKKGKEEKKQKLGKWKTVK